MWRIRRIRMTLGTCVFPMPLKLTSLNFQPQFPRKAPASVFPSRSQWIHFCRVAVSTNMRSLDQYIRILYYIHMPINPKKLRALIFLDLETQFRPQILAWFLPPAPQSKVFISYMDTQYEVRSYWSLHWSWEEPKKPKKNPVLVNFVDLQNQISPKQPAWFISNMASIDSNSFPNVEGYSTKSHHKISTHWNYDRATSQQLSLVLTISYF